MWLDWRFFFHSSEYVDVSWSSPCSPASYSQSFPVAKLSVLSVFVDERAEDRVHGSSFQRNMQVDACGCRWM